MDINETVIAYIRLVGSEFSGISDARLVEMIEFVKPMVAKEKFEKLYPHALAYLVCHHLKMHDYGPAGPGDVTIGDALLGGSVSEGETSVSYGSGQSVNLQPDAEYTLTIYGLKYLDLRKRVIVPITVRV